MKYILAMSKDGGDYLMVEFGAKSRLNYIMQGMILGFKEFGYRQQIGFGLDTITLSKDSSKVILAIFEEYEWKTI